jgi:hypothetical protein
MNHTSVITPGQHALRDYVESTAARIDPAVDWPDPPVLEALEALRARALSHRVIAEDACTGRDLRTPSVPATYVELQRQAYPPVRVPEVEVSVDHLLFSALDVGEPPIAAAGGPKWTSTYGALTSLARGKGLDITAEAPPTILSGSSVIAVWAGSIGAGSNHRTLATFLWRDATLEHRDGIYVSKDVVDPDLWRACEQIETACPPRLLRLGVLLPHDEPAETRARVIALGARAETDDQLAHALQARSRRRPPTPLLDIPDLHELETLT